MQNNDTADELMDPKGLTCVVVSSEARTDLPRGCIPPRLYPSVASHEVVVLLMCTVSLLVIKHWHSIYHRGP